MNGRRNERKKERQTNGQSTAGQRTTGQRTTGKGQANGLGEGGGKDKERTILNEERETHNQPERKHIGRQRRTRSFRSRLRTVLGRSRAEGLETLFNLTSACSGRRSLRSATKGDFLVPRARTATRQKRAFLIVGPSFWNDLPSELRSLPRDLSSSFYKLLKTLLFGRAWASE